MADISIIVQRIATMFPALLLALVIHEYSHALVAKLYGDRTALWQGRLTLNPTVHMDPIGTVVFPLLGIAFGGFIFGWAKPVPINPSEFRNFRRGIFWVSAAGPLSNLILGVLTAFFLPLIFSFLGGAGSMGNFGKEFLQSFLVLNFILFAFNLLPFPPLDGSKMLESFLSHEKAEQLHAIFTPMNTMFLFLFLIVTGAFRFIFAPVLAFAELLLGWSSMFWAMMF